MLFILINVRFWRMILSFYEVSKRLQTPSELYCTVEKQWTNQCTKKLLVAKLIYQHFQNISALHLIHTQRLLTVIPTLLKQQFALSCNIRGSSRSAQINWAHDRVQSNCAGGHHLAQRAGMMGMKLEDFFMELSWWHSYAAGGSGDSCPEMQWGGNS